MSDRRLAAIGAWGAALTLVVVAASVLLRLATTLDAGGNASSMLAPGTEAAIRLAHRLAASTVSLLALAAVVIAVRDRRAREGRVAIIACIGALTLFLSLIGVRTAGYRIAWITAGNVAGGVALACAFWWLREDSRGMRPMPDGRWVARAALAGLFLHATVGAFAASLAMRADRALAPVHIGLGPAVAALAVVAAARNHERQPAASWCVAVLAVAQLALGMIASAADGLFTPRWIHAMAGALLAIALVHIAAGRGTIVDARQKAAS